jgi:subtilisin family serine protease
MSTGSVSEGWYYLKRATGEQVGPVDWEQLYTAAQSGAFGPQDHVWHEQLPGWLPAAQVPGLFQAPAAPQQPVASEPRSTARRRRRAPLLAWLTPLIVVVLVGAGLGIYFGAFYHRGEPTAVVSSTTSTERTGTSTTGISEIASTSTSTTLAVDIGVVEVKAPDATKLIETTRWGEVPANQLAVVLVDGATDADAESVAQSIGGSVVGRIEYVKLYQIEFPSSSEAELQAALSGVRANAKVRLATVDAEASGDIEIWGVPLSPMDDPAYLGDYGGGYDLIGVDKAWRYIQACGLHLWPVRAGVVDSGLFKGTDEFYGDVDITYPRSGNGELQNAVWDNFKGVWWQDPDGSHGTAVTGIIAADPTNGGQFGVASMLGGKLTLSVSNHSAPPYGTKVVPPNPDDPTVVSIGGKSYAVGGLAAIIDQIEAGARVINCSWGNKVPKPKPPGWDEQNEILADLYRSFFTRMAAEHPEILFVCSAGNDQKISPVIDGTKRWPSGYALPNMITVGNIMNDGSVAPSSNRKNDTPGQEFEVTIAAPGDEAVRSVSADGEVRAGATWVAQAGVTISGGTSMAAPQVTSAAALLLSIKPDLTADQIKDLLTRTARPGPDELGGATLAIDVAVLELINQELETKGMDPLDPADTEKGGIVEAVARSTDRPDEYVIQAMLSNVPERGTEAHFFGSSRVTIPTDFVQEVKAPGEVIWPFVTVTVRGPEDVQTIRIVRMDNGASNIITFGTPDLNGHRQGTFTLGSIVAPPSTTDTTSELEGCDELEILGTVIERLIGQPVPMDMDVTADMQAGTGTAVALIDLASVVSKMPEVIAEGDDMSVKNEPMTLPFTVSENTITFQPQEATSATVSVTAVVYRQGDYVVMKGKMTMEENGGSFRASFKLVKREQWGQTPPAWKPGAGQ